jgi:SNF2 family DNA or RNA helicase
MNFKTQPFMHQLNTLERIKDRDYYALFWEMGTGKTKEAIDLIRYRCYEKGEAISVLIICPKIAILNWVDEFKIHSTLEKVVQPLNENRYKKEVALKDKSKKIFIVNFESVKPMFNALYKRWDMIIVDESQRIKNMQAISTKAIIKIGDLSRFRYILSGTPILNNPIDIFSQYRFLDGGFTFGKSFTTFRLSYFINVNADLAAKAGNNFKYFPKWELNKMLANTFKQKVQSIASVIKKEDCLDLPPKVYKTIHLEMGDKQRKMYEEMKKELIAEINDTKMYTVASTAAVKIMRLRQISSGFARLDGVETLAVFSDNPKMDALEDLLEEITINHKCIIWCAFRHDIEAIRDKFKIYNPSVIYGGTDANEKYDQQNKFRKDNTCRIMIAHPKSAGLAINLVEASYAIYYSQGFELENRLQSEDRCHRPGSQVHDKITYIDLIYKNSVDVSISKALKNKKDIGSDVLSQVKLILEGGE